MLDLHYGGPVAGDQRFPRPDLEKKLINFITHGAGVKMFGLRRIGKSTLLRFAGDTMEQQGYTVVSIDAQGMRSIDTLLFRVLNVLKKDSKTLFDKTCAMISRDPGIPDMVKKLFDLIPKGENKQEADRAISAYWPLFSRHIVQALKDEAPRLLLTIDELPFMIQNMIEDNLKTGAREVDQFLAALREWRSVGLKMIVSGSIGMAGLARQYGFRNEHLNDLMSLDIPELTETEARNLVQEANEGHSDGKWTEAHTEALFLELGAFYPSFLVKSLTVLNPGDPPPPEDFPDIFATMIRPELNDTFLNQFDRRYKRYKDMASNNSIPSILACVLKQPDGLSESDIQLNQPGDTVELREILTILAEDGFLGFREDREGRRTWKVASPLVVWWGRKTIL